MSSIIEIISKENSNIICCGDYNIDLLKIEERNIFQDYFDMFVVKGAIPQLTLPTRFSKKNATLIDQIFCKLSGKITNSNAGIFVTKISDHLPGFTYFDVLETKIKHPKFVKIRVNTEEALNNFKNDLKETLQNMNFENNLYTDPNESYDKLHNAIQISKEKFLPVKVVRFKKYKHKISPWMTNGILKSIKMKDKMYRTLKKTNPLSLNYITLEYNLKIYCSMLQKCIRIAKSSYYHNQFEKYKSDIKKTWNQIHELIRKKR